MPTGTLPGSIGLRTRGAVQDDDGDDDEDSATESENDDASVRMEDDEIAAGGGGASTPKFAGRGQPLNRVVVQSILQLQLEHLSAVQRKPTAAELRHITLQAYEQGLQQDPDGKFGVHRAHMLDPVKLTNMRRSIEKGSIRLLREQAEQRKSSDPSELTERERHLLKCAQIIHRYQCLEEQLGISHVGKKAVRPLMAVSQLEDHDHVVPSRKRASNASSDRGDRPMKSARSETSDETDDKLDELIECNREIIRLMQQQTDLQQRNIADQQRHRELVERLLEGILESKINT